MDMPDVQPLDLNAYIIQKKLGFCSLTFQRKQGLIYCLQLYNMLGFCLLKKIEMSFYQQTLIEISLNID